MAQPRRTEDCLDALSRLRENPAAPEAPPELGRYLAHKSNLAAAKAAKLVAEFEIEDLEPQLVAAFHRFMKSPALTDKGCAAKTEIVRALEASGAAEAEVFLAGIRHIQMEGSFGPPVDTAAGLRAASAMGLVHMNHPDAILETVSLLVDREDDARIGAVRALAAAGHPATVPLLRFKALAGDASADVIAESFLALLEVAPETSLGFVAGYLDSTDAGAAEAAAIALGESRQPEAIVVLKSKWPGAGETLRRALLMGMAVARDDNAFEFLFSLIETAVEKIAAEAITALAVYRQDECIRGRVESLVGQRKGALLVRTLAAEFGTPRK
jgi:HEAT repeat protein